MSRIVRCSLIQATNVEAVEEPLAKIKQAMLDKHIGLIHQAAEDGAQIGRASCRERVYGRV